MSTMMFFEAMFDDTYINTGTAEKPKNETIRAALWSTDAHFFRIAKSKLIDEYIENETKKFMEQVDSLSQQVNDLKNGIDYEE